MEKGLLCRFLLLRESPIATRTLLFALPLESAIWKASSHWKHSSIDTKHYSVNSWQIFIFSVHFYIIRLRFLLWTWCGMSFVALEILISLFTKKKLEKIFDDIKNDVHASHELCTMHSPLALSPSALDWVQTRDVNRSLEKIFFPKKNCTKS